jgi:hypothetical protein
MLAVAEAACKAAAAAAAQDLRHAAAWTRAFAAYAAAVPQQLLQPLDAAGGSLREALLHVSDTPYIVGTLLAAVTDLHIMRCCLLFLLPNKHLLAV